MKSSTIQLPGLVFFVVFVSVLTLGTPMLSIDSDLGRHLTLGNYILNNRFVPTHDLFSHTLTGASRPPYEWLSQVAFAIVHWAMGLDGVILLTALLIGVSIVIVFQQAVRYSQSPLIAFFIALLAAAATSLHWLPRPHVITFLLLAIWINSLEKLRAGKQVGIYVFPLIMLFWVNLHGGFVFGFLAFAAYFAGWLWDRWQKRSSNEIGKQYILIGLASLAASVITPDLWRNWEAVFNNRSVFILSRTVETMPPNLSDPSIAPFAILLFLSAIFFLAHWRTVSASHVFLLTGLGFMSLLMVRNIPLFAIASAPILSALISKTLSKNSRWKNFDRRFVNLAALSRPYLFPAVVITLAVGFFAYNHSQGRQVYQFNSRVFPVHAVDWLEKNPIEGNMFNEFNWGGYLLYRRWPRDLVFVDSQSDFYGEELMRDYAAIMTANENSQALLNEYQVAWVIIPAESPLALELRQDSNWEISYEDSVAIIIKRK